MNLLQKVLQFFSSFFGRPQISQEAPRPPEPPPVVVPPAIRRISLVEELRGALTRECIEIGYETARRSGRRTPDMTALKTLEGLAEAKALSQSGGLSRSGQEDLLRRLKDWEMMLEQRVLDRDGAASKLNASFHALAATPEPGAYPELSAALRFCAVAWLTMSLSPTLHDLLTGFDPFMKWVVGIATAAGISIAILHGILPTANAKMGARSKTVSRHYGAAGAGILLGLGFFGLRLSGARTYGDVLLACALAVMEVGAVVLVERKAKPLFEEIEAWRDRLSARRMAEAQVDADQRELTRRQSLADEAGDKITEIEDALERAHAAGDAKLMTGIAVNAIKAGYMKGISGNAADLGGAA